MRQQSVDAERIRVDYDEDESFQGFGKVSGTILLLLLMVLQVSSDRKQ